MYAEQGPHDEIQVLGTRVDGDALVARYSWLRGDGTGELRLEPGDAGIDRLTVSFDPPAPTTASEGDPLDPERIKLMNNLLMSMPGTPIVYYGDEIGMGDNIYLKDRDGQILLSMAPAEHPDAAGWQPSPAFQSRFVQRQRSQR